MYRVCVCVCWRMQFVCYCQQLSTYRHIIQISYFFYAHSHALRAACLYFNHLGANNNVWCTKNLHTHAGIYGICVVIFKHGLGYDIKALPATCELVFVLNSPTSCHKHGFSAIPCPSHCNGLVSCSLAACLICRRTGYSCFSCSFSQLSFEKYIFYIFYFHCRFCNGCISHCFCAT